MSDVALQLTVTRDGVRVPIRVQPRASSTGIAGIHGGALKVRLTAPPADGAANEMLVEFLAATFGIPERDIRIVAGLTSRSKVVELAGVGEARVRQLATD